MSLKIKAWNIMLNNKILLKLDTLARHILTYISPKLASKIIYRVRMRKKLNLKEPIDFNEKVMWLKLNTYYNNSLITKCTDKYKVREYIINLGCEEILNELIATYDSVSEINWDNLPDSFVLKCNHGCGYNIICSNKSVVNKKEIIQQLKKWMKEDYYLNFAEVNYKYIKKKIICEKYLCLHKGYTINDYKIYCFDGEPYTCLVCFDREVDLQLKYYDLNWNEMNIGNSDWMSKKSIEKPKCFDKMIYYSRILSKGFPFVRMDFYDIDGEVVFGEMTFTPAAGIAKYYSEYGLKVLGDKIDLQGRGK